MSDDRLDVAPETVAALIADQFPEWSDLPVRAVVPGGWDNRTFRLGKTLGVRMPSAERYAGKIAKEAEWLPKLGSGLRFAVPKPAGVGNPAQAYPFPWLVFHWLDGETLGDSDPALRSDAGFAHSLATALTELHALKTEGGPAAGEQNFHRGGDLAVYDAETRRLVAALPEPDQSRAAAIWEKARSSRWEAPGRWLHGDVSEGNILLRNGRFAGLLDFGLCGVGDPASDLVPYWTIFEGHARDAFRQTFELDDATWARAAGWALWKALLVAEGAPRDATALRCLAALGLLEDKTACDGS